MQSMTIRNIFRMWHITVSRSQDDEVSVSLEPQLDVVPQNPDAEA